MEILSGPPLPGADEGNRYRWALVVARRSSYLSSVPQQRPLHGRLYLSPRQDSRAPTPLKLLSRPYARTVAWPFSLVASPSVDAYYPQFIGLCRLKKAGVFYGNQSRVDRIIVELAEQRRSNVRGRVSRTRTSLT